MTHKERIYAAIKGEVSDRIPVALWQHFPRHDNDAQRFARKVIEFQQRYGFDLVKVTPVAGYPAEAWGAQLYYKDNANGTRGYTSRPVNVAKDWEALPALDVQEGVLGRQLQALRLIRQGVGNDVHVLQTIFSPLTIAKTLSEHWKAHLLKAPETLHAGLVTITNVMIAFTKACLQCGADAVFFATQLATQDELTLEQYKTFGQRYDLQLLEAVRPHTEFVLLHGHGSNLMFDLLCDYPVHVLNWHDRGEGAPTLAQGLEKFSGAVLGGLNERVTLVQGTPEAIQNEARNAIKQTGGRRFILGTGCVTLQNTPEANLQAVRAVCG